MNEAGMNRTSQYRCEEDAMPQGDKSSYSSKQRRKAEHIEEGYEKRGVSKKTAQKRAWATVNKQDGGGKKSGSGRKAAKKSTSSKTATKKSA
jgi:plasmid stabilization system protein ParE